MAEFNPILDTLVSGYRKGESMPTKMDAKTVADIVLAARDAEPLGMPKMSITKIADQMLLEGREDAGTNNFNVNNKKAFDLYTKLIDKGHSRVGATFAASVLDKDQVAKRLGISFDEAWNGTGKSRAGRTGAQHAERANQMRGAWQDPKNNDLISYMTRVASGKLTKLEHLATMPDETLVSMAFGAPASDSVEYLTSSSKSPFNAAYQKAVKEVTGKDHELPTGHKEDVMRWEYSARRILADVIRSNLGINASKTNWNFAPRAQISGNPQLQQVFQKLAEQAIQSLGVKPEDK